MVMLVLLVVLINTNGVRKDEADPPRRCSFAPLVSSHAWEGEGDKRALKFSVREARKRNETAGVVQRLHTLHTSVGGAGICFFPSTHRFPVFAPIEIKGPLASGIEKLGIKESPGTSVSTTLKNHQVSWKNRRFHLGIWIIF
jgi:hypothetical protein